MTVYSAAGGGFLAGKQVFPIDYQAQVSQRLVDASYSDDLSAALECIADPFVDVNFVGTVCLRTRKTKLVLNDESPIEVRFEHEEFKTEVTALFLAAHAGNLALVRKLLSLGADQNEKLFRGYATTAAVREGHVEILEVLVNGGANQAACEDALLEASYVGRARPAELLMNSNMIRPHVAVHALVVAACRGFLDLVNTLIKCGVDPNAKARVLLRSSKPSLHSNVDCNALVAAIVSRQISTVRMLLQVGVRTNIEVRLGAWTWDTATGEEFRVGAGLAEPYSATWCAVEYFEASGSILQMLLKNLSPNVPHLGRTILHHAILCNNVKAVDVLLNCRADLEFPIQTTGEKTNFFPVHLASRPGTEKVLQRLVSGGCNINSKTDEGDTPIMICARHKNKSCFKHLAEAGADFGEINLAGQSAESIAATVKWSIGFQEAVIDLIREGKVVRSRNPKIFSPLLFLARANDIEAMRKVLDHSETDVNEQDADGFTAAMVAAEADHLEAFRLLVHAGADVTLQNRYGETAISLAEANKRRCLFEDVILEHEREKGSHSHNSAGFYPLHQAVQRGDLESVERIIRGGYDVDLDLLDIDGYTPLMLAAIEGQGKMCQVLVKNGARCDIENTRYETALMLARKRGQGNDAERVILDELARALVLGGALVKKHTKGGKGSPHRKLLKMVPTTGILRWGRSSKRNVICKGAEVGPSSTFRWNRRKKSDADEPGVFRVVTTKNNEVHLLCEGGIEMARLWVRGIELVTREAIFGKEHQNIF